MDASRDSKSSVENLTVDPRLEQASTLPSAFYKDPAYFELSKDRIFSRSWQWIGDLDAVKVPGAVWPQTLLEACLDEPVVVTRDTQDKLHVLSNVCTHRGMLVAENPGNERFLRCRYHGRRFGLDGRFQSMPEFEGVCHFPSDRDHLPRIDFDTWGPFLFLNLAPQGPLDQYLRPIEERLSWFPVHELRLSPEHSRDYLVKANWALYCDNYLEGFHIPFIHAALNEALDYGDYTIELLPHGALQIATSKGSEGIFDLPKDSPDTGRKISAYYYWMFPNLMLNFYPWGLSVNVLKPQSHEMTRVCFRCYVLDPSKMNVGAGAELDRVEREDEVVVEGVQKGVKSRFYDRGRFSVAREGAVHHFHRMIADALGQS